jgi:hypothetical protein
MKQLSALYLVLLTLACLSAQPLAGQQSRGPIPFSFQYAVKLLCTSNTPGTSGEDAGFLPGTYRTVVNIHNPLGRTVRIREKIAPDIVAPTPFVGDLLKPDFVSRVDCTQLGPKFGIFPVHGLEGFLIIESTGSLDVTAVHMAGPRGGDVSSIAVEQVLERPTR